jgi:hypothetical protein
VTFREVLTIVKSVLADIAAPMVAAAEVIEMSPAEVRVPVPEKVPDPVTVMFPEPVVVWFPFIAIAPPIKFKSPAIDGAAAIVIGPVFPDLPMVSPVAPVNAQVESNVVSLASAELNEVEEGMIETVPEVLATTAPAAEFAATSGNRSLMIVMFEDEDPPELEPNSIWWVAVAYCKSIPFEPKSTAICPVFAKNSKFLA